jgi:hypothetical protein
MRAASFALLAALAALFATAAQAQFLSPEDKAHETPEAFARRITDVYGPDADWAKAAPPDAFQTYDRRVQAEFYDPGFKTLLDDNRQLAARWRIDGVDHSPLCQCQQPDVRVGLESLEQARPDQAEAHMSSCPDPASGCIAYVLVLKRSAAAWRVDDVIEDGDSLRATLEKDNACMRTAGSQADLKRCWR